MAWHIFFDASTRVSLTTAGKLRMSIKYVSFRWREQIEVGNV